MRVSQKLWHKMPIMQLPAMVGMGTRKLLDNAAETFSPNPIRDRTTLFHGTGFHLPRVKSVLSKGLVSQKSAERMGVPLVPNFVNGYNGDSKICLSKYEGNRFSFGDYSAGKLSIIVEGAGLKTETSALSGYQDERMVAGPIPPNLFRGLMVPTEKLDTPLSALPIGLMMGPSTNVLAGVKAYLEAIKGECGHREEHVRLFDGIDAYRKLSRDEKLGPHGRDVEKWIEYKLAMFTHRAYAYKLGGSLVTLRRALRATIPETTRLFDFEGQPATL